MADKLDILIEGPDDARWTIILAHGAGAGMHTPFMDAFASGLASKGFRAIRFEFPYMAERAQGTLQTCPHRAKRRPPDREPVLRATWLAVIEQVGRHGLIIGGKSMGGRIASLVADEAEVAGLVCLGYPFHPTGQPDKLRISHLETIKTPTLILQGTRDPFGNRNEVAGYRLSPAVNIHWLDDGDHSFKPRKASGRTERQNWDEAIERLALFASGLADRA